MSDAQQTSVISSQGLVWGYQQAFDYLSPDKAAEMANELLPETNHLRTI